MAKEYIPFTPPTESELMLMQPNNVTFGQYSLTEIQENILTLITEKVQKYVTKSQELPRDLFNQPYIEIICDDAGGKNNKARVLKEALAMTSQHFSFKWLHPKMNKEIQTTGTIITTAHDIKNSNRITLNFNVWALPFLMYYGVGVGGTLFGRTIALKVRGNYTKRLYKFICSQRDKREYFYSIEQFKKDMEIQPLTTNSNLIQKILKPAKKRIDEMDSDVTFDYEMIAKHPISGRKPKADTILFKINAPHPRECDKTSPHHQDYMYVFNVISRALNNYSSSEPRDICDKLVDLGKLSDVLKRCQFYDDEIMSGKKTRPHADNAVLKMLREEYNFKTPKK